MKKRKKLNLSEGNKFLDNVAFLFKKQRNEGASTSDI